MWIEWFEGWDEKDMQFNADLKIGRIIMTNVNAEDNESMDKVFTKIHRILARFEWKL